jgi:hypothetical protein
MPATVDATDDAEREADAGTAESQAPAPPFRGQTFPENAAISLSTRKLRASLRTGKRKSFVHKQSCYNRGMLLYRALKFLFTVSCRRFAPADVFVASAADVRYLVGLVEPLTDEATVALSQVPPPSPY